MDDKTIIALFNDRDESAIEQIRLKYGDACRRLVFGILKNKEDTEEAMSDLYLTVWNNIPPDCPENLGGYVYKTARYTALEAYRKNRRSGSAVTTSIEELGDCVSGDDTETGFDEKQLSQLIDIFLSSQSAENRRIFICRYFYNMKYNQIAKKYGIGLSRVKMSVKRTKEKLRAFLQREGY
ncbi:MAG: sigma-70 family RNA polymerase sigma factor [Clostridia bacterium]|nr:sigma-70 family RNA polymerase sigma factor [Clostridia bacterium]